MFEETELLKSNPSEELTKAKIATYSRFFADFNKASQRGAKIKMVDSMNMMLLFGSSDVVTALNDFFDAVQSTKEKEGGLCAMSNLIAHMRNDLGIDDEVNHEPILALLNKE